MNGYQRVLSTFDGTARDRTALMPITMMYAADRIGEPYGLYAADHRILVRGQLETARTWGFDHVSVISDPAREAADFGAKVHFFEDQPPSIDETEALLADKSRLRHLGNPDPEREGSRMFDRVCAVRRLAEQVKGELLIEGWVEGPCAEAADLRGINTLMFDMTDDPGFVVALFEKALETGIRFATAQVRAGADIIGIGDAAASLIGPRRYRELVLPFERKLVDAVHALGARVRLHICGNISRSLGDIGTLGCDLVDLDSMVSVEAARAEMGPEQALAGNIDPVKMLRNGTPEKIHAALVACEKQAGSRYVAAAGCEVPRDTSEENLRALCDFAKNGPEMKP